MKHTFQAVRLGLRDLPGYGPHQEAGFFVILLLAAIVIGLVQGGPFSAAVGLVGGALIYGPIFLFTAYVRGRDYLENER